MEPSDAKKLRALEAESAKSKNLLAEQMRENAMLRDVNAKSGNVRCQAQSGGPSDRGSSGEPAQGVFRLERGAVIGSASTPAG